MNIYLPDSLHGEIPTGFNAVALTLDAGLDSRLEWKEQVAAAVLYVEKNVNIFWMLDFGFQANSDFSPPQTESLRLAVEHFHTTVWDRFSESSVGVCLYRGDQKIDEHSVRVLEQLAGSLPDEAEAFLLLDASALVGPIEISRALSKERFPHFTLAVKGVEAPLPEFGWETIGGSRGMIGQVLLDSGAVEPKIGICVPAEVDSFGLDQVALRLKQAQLPFRMIPEALLTGEWGGLDAVIVDASSVTRTGKRRLMGFCAAGGTIVTCGDLLGLPIEVGLEEWLKSEHPAILNEDGHKN